jgi:hypothetical protein
MKLSAVTLGFHDNTAEFGPTEVATVLFGMTHETVPASVVKLAAVVW